MFKIENYLYHYLGPQLDQRLLLHVHILKPLTQKLTKPVKSEGNSNINHKRTRTMQIYNFLGKAFKNKETKAHKDVKDSIWWWKYTIIHKIATIKSISKS